MRRKWRRGWRTGHTYAAKPLPDKSLQKGEKAGPEWRFRDLADGHLSPATPASVPRSICVTSRYVHLASSYQNRNRCDRPVYTRILGSRSSATCSGGDGKSTWFNIYCQYFCTIEARRRRARTHFRSVPCDGLRRLGIFSYVRWERNWCLL